MELTLKSGLPIKLDHIPENKIDDLGKACLSLINLLATDMSRDTHYQSKEEMESIRKKLHKDLFDIDRGIYSAIFCLPGTIEYSISNSIKVLLSNPWREHTKSILPVNYENMIIEKHLRNMPPNKVLNMFVDMIENKVNNSRTRRYMLTYILKSPSLELWSVKYRPKIKKILTHCWGKKYINVVRAILTGSDKKAAMKKLTPKEEIFLEQDIFKHKNKELSRFQIKECIAFILGLKGNYDTKLLKAYNEAKTDLTKGAGLPPDVLEGIRSTYHPKAKQATVLEVSKNTMTEKQKKLVQNKAKKEGVEIEFDPKQFPLSELFIYAYKMGMDDELKKVIKEKAEKASKSLPFKYNRIGIVFDSSISMFGSDTQPLRPISVACAMREILRYSADEVFIEYNNKIENGNLLVIPEGETSLAISFCKVLEKEPNAIFILSDGYENTPAGRLDEVMQILKRIGHNIPVYHINPVSASESKTGIRQLSKLIPVMPVSKPESIGLTFFKPMLEVDTKTGIIALLKMVLPSIENKNNEVI